MSCNVCRKEPCPYKDVVRMVSMPATFISNDCEVNAGVWGGGYMARPEFVSKGLPEPLWHKWLGKLQGLKIWQRLDTAWFYLWNDWEEH